MNHKVYKHRLIYILTMARTKINKGIRNTFSKAFRTLKKEFIIDIVGTKINCCRSCHFANYDEKTKYLFSDFFQCTLKEYESRDTYYIYWNVHDIMGVCIRLSEILGKNFNVKVPKDESDAIIIEVL